VDRGWRVQETQAHRNREGGPPDLIGAVNPWRDRWHEPGASGIRHSGFPAARTWSRGFRDPRSPEGDGAEWDPGDIVGSRWRARGTSEFRHSGN
jgi:hypothetical protein